MASKARCNRLIDMAPVAWYHVTANGVEPDSRTCVVGRKSRVGGRQARMSGEKRAQRARRASSVCRENEMSKASWRSYSISAWRIVARLYEGVGGRASTESEASWRAAEMA